MADSPRCTSAPPCLTKRTSVGAGVVTRCIRLTPFDRTASLSSMPSMQATRPLISSVGGLMDTVIRRTDLFPAVLWNGLRVPLTLLRCAFGVGYRISSSGVFWCL